MKTAIAFVCVLLVLTACIVPSPTPTKPPTVTASPRPATTTPQTSPIQPPTVTPLPSPLEPAAMLRTPTPRPTPNCGLLSNCSFEGDYQCHGSICNPPEWTAWYIYPPPCWAGEPGCFLSCPRNCMKTESACFDPNNQDPKKCICDRTLGYGCWFQPPEQVWETNQFPERVRSGEKAAEQFSWGREHWAGYYQQITVPDPDAEYEFSIHAQAWMCYTCTNGLTDWPKDFHLKIGIDPTGGTSPTSTQIIWSQEVNSWDAYSRLSVRARPAGRGLSMTLFTSARADWGTDHLGISNNVYLDDALFREVHDIYLPLVVK